MHDSQKITFLKGTFGSLGPIRASLEHFLVITQSALLRVPAHQSVGVSQASQNHCNSAQVKNTELVLC